MIRLHPPVPGGAIGHDRIGWFAIGVAEDSGAIGRLTIGKGAIGV